jgi:signal transduction histidine kinase
LPQFATYLDELRNAIHDRQPRSLEKVETRTDGERRYANVLVFPLIANGITGAVIRVDDVTERVRLEEMMIQAEKMVSVGGLAAGMAHEINNPLGAIIQGAQNIERRLSTNLPVNVTVAEELGLSIELMRRYLDQRDIFKFLTGIRESGERAARIVSNMLQFSRRSQAQFQPTALDELLDRAVELASNDYDLKKRYDFKHIEIVRDYAPGLPSVPLSVTEIEQVFLNLLKNSAHALLNRANSAPPRIILRTRRESDWAIIEVADNGSGMEESARKRVFEPFFTTKEVGVGTGLGLSVSYMIITNNHKGAIAVESAPNQGTTFTIRLPLERK